MLILYTRHIKQVTPGVVLLFQSLLSKPLTEPMRKQRKKSLEKSAIHNENDILNCTINCVHFKNISTRDKTTHILHNLPFPLSRSAYLCQPRPTQNLKNHKKNPKRVFSPLFFFNKLLTPGVGRRLITVSRLSTTSKTAYACTSRSIPDLTP